MWPPSSKPFSGRNPKRATNSMAATIAYCPTRVISMWRFGRLYEARLWALLRVRTRRSHEVNEETTCEELAWESRRGHGGQPRRGPACCSAAGEAGRGSGVACAQRGGPLRHLAAVGRRGSADTGCAGGCGQAGIGDASEERE